MRNAEKAAGGADGEIPRRHDLRTEAERMVRRAWEGDTSAYLRAGGAVVGLFTDLRHYLYDTGILASEATRVSVISVGGLTVGGSGKTPLAARCASWLSESGASPAVVTHGYADELAVHRRLNPDVPVLGARDRSGAVAAAARGGAHSVVLDSGFQHRRLQRDLDVVVVDTSSVAKGNFLRLPAGPFRERWSELGRADFVVVCRREPDGRVCRRISAWLRARCPWIPTGRCRLLPGDLEPCNERALSLGGRADPAAAVCSVMWPEPFFAQTRRRAHVREEFVLSDHEEPDEETLERIMSVAGRRGVVGTLKDVVKLEGRLGERTPLWCLGERLLWEEGGDRLRDMVTRTAGSGSGWP